MTQKRFIKLMRMLRYPRHLINKAVNTVNLRGGSLSYYDYARGCGEKNKDDKYCEKYRKRG